MPKFRISPAHFLPFLLAGCATAQGSFPSLAPRAVERELAGRTAVPPCPGMDESPPALAKAPSPQPVNPDPQLGARAAELLAAARDGQAAFAAALPAAEAAAGGAGSPESESWIAAQLEISRLEAARARTVEALAELDALAIRRGDQPVDDADYQSLLAAVEDARTLANQQQAQLDRISGRLSAP